MGSGKRSRIFLAAFFGLNEGVHVLFTKRGASRAPCCEDEGEAGLLAPRERQVQHVRVLAFDRERGISDDEGAALAHDIFLRLGCGHANEADARISLREKQLGEDHARARRKIEAHLFELLDRALRKHGHATHRAARADRHSGYERDVTDRRGSGDWHERDVRFVLGEPPRDLRRQREIEGKSRVLVEAVHERERIQIAHAGDANARICCASVFIARVARVRLLVLVRAVRGRVPFRVTAVRVARVHFSRSAHDTTSRWRFALRSFTLRDASGTADRANSWTTL